MPTLRVACCDDLWSLGAFVNLTQAKRFRAHLPFCFDPVACRTEVFIPFGDRRIGIEGNPGVVGHVSRLKSACGSTSTESIQPRCHSKRIKRRNGAAGSGQRIHAIVDAPDGVTEADLRVHMKEQLVSYKCPDSYEFVDEPVRDDAGKVRRSLLASERS